MSTPTFDVASRVELDEMIRELEQASTVKNTRGRNNPTTDEMRNADFRAGILRRLRAAATPKPTIPVPVIPDGPLRDLTVRVHTANANWWRDITTGERIVRNKGELIALMHTEVDEAFAGHRDDSFDDHLPHLKAAAVELADTQIRILDYAGGFGVALSGTMSNKGESDWVGVETWQDALLVIHSALSRLTEHERKGRTAEAAAALSDAFHSCERAADLIGRSDAIRLAFLEKLAYNSQRADHKHENRAKDDGKKW